MTSTYPVIKGTLLSSDNYTWNTADSVGRGASAVVFLGRHKVEGTVVAIKSFHDHVSHGYKQEDLRELELLRNLNHPNIIKLRDIERELTQKKTVLIMEYCEGGSLHHMLDQPAYCFGLPEMEFLLVLKHVAAGMRYLREKNVIHRDIKPGNIMRYLNSDGFSVYKLTDFGAARSLDEDENFTSLYGTEEYLHPGIYERAVLKLPTAQSFDAKVDLWSLGVTFYHTATGRLPFQPYGGRQNKMTMFEIITRKDSGVISGVQNFQDGPIEWKRDLPETSPLSSGLKSIVVPLLAGLMEPDESRMISYESFFKIVDNVRQKSTVGVFHFSRCENLKVYADLSMTLPALQDLIASLTDISASDQILLVGGHCLDTIVNPMTPLKDYPPRLLKDSIFLFQREMFDNMFIYKPEIPNFKDFSAYSDVDADARLAHNCAGCAQLICRFHRTVQEHQHKLMDGLLYLRLYVEAKLMGTRNSQESMRVLMDDCQCHFNIFFTMVKTLRISMPQRQHSKDLEILDSILQDTVIRQVHKKATERIFEIENYRDSLVKKLEEVAGFANKVQGVCADERCSEKMVHHMNMISSVQSRFRRDKSVKHQMTNHDDNIHRFERQKLQVHCATMKSIFTDHCLKQLENVYKSALHSCESLTKCLSRVLKIEKNIHSVLNCQKLLNDKVVKLGKKIEQLGFVKDSGFEESHKEHVSGASWSDFAQTSAGMSVHSYISDEAEMMSIQARDLRNKLFELKQSLQENSDLMKGLEEPLQSSGSLSRQLDQLHMQESQLYPQQYNLPIPESTSVAGECQTLSQLTSYPTADFPEGVALKVAPSNRINIPLVQSSQLNYITQNVSSSFDECSTVPDDEDSLILGHEASTINVEYSKL